MTFIKPDFSEVTDNVGPGTYSARVIGQETGAWPGKDGKPDTHFVKWTLETFNEEDPKNNGRRIFHRTPISGKGAFLFQQFYRAAFGNTEIPEDGIDLETFLGKEMTVTMVDGVDRVTKEPTGYVEVKSVAQLK